MIITNYKEFESNGAGRFLTGEDAYRWCQSVDISNFEVEDDGTVNVEDSVDLSGVGWLDRIPVRFGKVYGSFSVRGTGIKSLANCPHFVGNVFDCSGNKLKSLKGGPEQVGSDYACDESGLKSLVGAPDVVEGSFTCTYNELNSLKGGPDKVLENYQCDFNYFSTLEGAPKIVGGTFSMRGNENLITLEGIPASFSDYICDVMDADIEDDMLDALSAYYSAISSIPQEIKDHASKQHIYLMAVKRSPMLERWLFPSGIPEGLDVSDMDSLKDFL